MTPARAASLASSCVTLATRADATGRAAREVMEALDRLTIRLALDAGTVTHTRPDEGGVCVVLGPEVRR